MITNLLEVKLLGTMYLPLELVFRRQTKIALSVEFCLGPGTLNDSDRLYVFMWLNCRTGLQELLKLL